MSNSLTPNFLLEWAREAGREHPFFDFHIHPFDVLTGDTTYQVNSQPPGLFSKPGCSYHPPAFAPTTGEAATPPRMQNVAAAERALLLASRLAYTHTGSRVVSDHLELAGLSGALLLPVVRCPGAAETTLAMMQEMFSNDVRYFYGCPFPIGVPPEGLHEYFRVAKDNWPIRAIKVHSNLINLDPASPIGLASMEATLEAAGCLGLPVIVHGGRTPGLTPAEKMEYGTLEHLSQVNWGLSDAPVVIAHAGCYGLPDDELPVALSILNDLLEKFPNVMADVSNLGLVALQTVLRSVDRSRLIFGSDALYVPVWKAWLRFLEALYLVSPNPKKDLVKIASTNPLQCLSISEQRHSCEF